ncbi:DUF5008 domain-containing protein [Pedobacter deserti]|uniref:DUF5008 domain-containing protein n=1 Tax=Pedobacter deserti TaxID=2817382 RepID=UPI00210988BA|nr:DUF5008 domain-containing protein [Pedobacter sp. SYSU D00382]
MKYTYTPLLTLLLAGAVLTGCKKSQEIFEDPYAGGVPALGIIVDPQSVASPASGNAGTVVTINAKGLVKYWDEKRLKFLFNGEEATIKNVTDSKIEVEVPATASTGVTSFVVDGQLVFGPDFSVLGKVTKDPTFRAINGANGYVTKIKEVANGNLIFLGNFDNFDNKGNVRRINKIARTTKDGVFDRTFQIGNGATGQLNDMAIIGSQFFPVGGFGGFAQRGGISNITRIANNGVIDTMKVITYEKRERFVPTFNGGTDGGIDNAYARDGKVIISGNFRYYVSRRYDQPTRDYKDSTILDSIEMRQLARLNPTDGTLDKTWRFDPNAVGYKGELGKGLPGANGPIRTIMHDDGKILVFGRFTTFDNTNVGSIVRLNADGSIDQTFNPGGAGADQDILSVSYNATLNKYLIVGAFRNYNGAAAPFMAMLNYNGTLDQSFQVKNITGGLPEYAKILSDGLIVIGGSFKSYGGTIRNGFMILDQTGSLAAGYNNIGNVLGGVSDVLETTSAEGKRALLIVGGFFTFDNVPTNRIVRVTLD